MYPHTIETVGKGASTAISYGRNDLLSDIILPRSGLNASHGSPFLANYGPRCALALHGKHHLVRIVGLIPRKRDPALISDSPLGGVTLARCRLRGKVIRLAIRRGATGRDFSIGGITVCTSGSDGLDDIFILVALLRLDGSPLCFFIRSIAFLTGGHGIGASTISLLFLGRGTLLDWILIRNTIGGADSTLLVNFCGIFGQFIGLFREVSLELVKF